MDWVLRGPQIHSTFSNLGFAHADRYYVSENCNAALESILHNLLTEDLNLRTYRRNVNIGQYIQKDLIPLLIHAKEDKTIELLIKILVNLTIPVECLLPLDVMSKTDFDSHTIFEINNLLAATKFAFTDHRATRVVVEFLKKNFEIGQEIKLPAEMCTNVNNGLLLLRNILHIADDSNTASPKYSGRFHAVQNQILWNIFSQSIDKILIRLMTLPDAAFWGVTLAQLIAILYKDQNTTTLHKLLNVWLETSLSESSDDESNTSSPYRAASDYSSTILTSGPTSDSSDTGGSGKSNDEVKSNSNEWNSTSDEQLNNENKNDQTFQMTTESKKQINDTGIQEIKQELSDKMDETNVSDKNTVEFVQENHRNQSSSTYKKNKSQDHSGCGYGTQIKKHESTSTSSNDDDLPAKKPVHQKPNNPKQRANTKVRSAGITLQDRRRKKFVKSGKFNIISNLQGSKFNDSATDDDIAKILNEFTVVFLLKGYNSLVQTLHGQILTNSTLDLDPDHFFWLVTYFLKFAAQIELDFKHVCSVLSYDIVSYLTAEGIKQCEHFELAIKLDGKDLKLSLQRLHLVVTAIREFVQAINVFKKISHISKEDQDTLTKLQIKMCKTEEFRSLLVLLIRHYNPKYQSKQYLQDLIVTNHAIFIFLDSVIKLPEYNGTTNMLDHVKQFATPKLMHQYGLLLEDFASNEEYVNDCVFSLMHHVGGDLDCLMSLFQPKILKIFTFICQSEFEICDDWSDLILYVINMFTKKFHTLQSKVNFILELKNVETIDQKPEEAETDKNHDKNCKNINETHASIDGWTKNELKSLNWNYMQSKTMPDVIGELTRLFKEDGSIKTRHSIVQELYKHKLINKREFDRLSRMNGEKQPKPAAVNKEVCNDEIGKLCEQLSKDGKSVFLDWIQKVLLETCWVKSYLDRSLTKINTSKQCEVKLLYFECFKKKAEELPVMSTVSYHSLLFGESVPLVPWNCEQAAICKDLTFLQLLHKIGLQMPVDTGKVFIRIPHFWTSNTLFEVASKLGHTDTKNLKFRPFAASQIHASTNPGTSTEQDTSIIPSTSNFSQTHKQEKITPNTCETASVASDLTRMYVSDEDEKPKPAPRPVRRRRRRPRHAVAPTHHSIGRLYRW